jgi:hypothetical protein
MIAIEDARQTAPDKRVTCSVHGTWNDVVHREREH